MSHIHWVPRQNKLEIPNDEEDVNTREIHKCDGQAHDPEKGTSLDSCDSLRIRTWSYIHGRIIVVYYKSRKRELKAKLMNESVR